MKSRRAPWLLVALLALAGCGSQSRAAGPPTDRSDAMSLTLQLSIDRTRLIAGEDTPLSMLLTNAGSAAITIPDPTRDMTWPQVRVLRKSDNSSRSFGPFSAGSERGSEFTSPLTAPNITLAPGQSAKVEGLLSRRAEFPAAGDYELIARFEAAGQVAESKPVAVTIDPLALRSVRFTGAHSGHNPVRYSTWSQSAGSGSVVLLSSVGFDMHGHSYVTFSNRLAEVDHAAEPAISVSANKLPYPKQWIAWLHGDALHTMYIEQGRVKLPPKPQPLGSSAPASRIIAPLLLDLEGNDGSKPGECDVLLLQIGAPGAKSAKVQVRRILADGSLKPAGLEIDLGSGELRIAQAQLLSNHERRLVAWTLDGPRTAMSLARWTAAKPPTTKRLMGDDGEPIAAGLTLDDSDITHGATLLAVTSGDATVYRLRTWRIDADGDLDGDPARVLALPDKLKIDRAIIELSEHGNVACLLKTSDGRWRVANRDGAVEPLDANVIAGGEPVGMFWLIESEPQLIIADRDRGLLYRDVHGHH